MKIALLDLDNTLIDADYNLTSTEDEFCSIVCELAKRDVHVGLCSDSAIITLKQWTERLGFSGPIVAERGAVVWNSVLQIEEVLEPSATEWFCELRELFVRKISKDFPGATIILGDATRFVKDRPVNRALTSQIFAVNGFRVASFSFFACQPNQDRSVLVPNAELLVSAGRIVAELIESLGKNKGNLFWDENLQYGILIVHARTTEKWRGVSTLIDRLKPEQVIMVGDGMSDFLGLQNVTQYAVGNADSRYKEKSAFVSEFTLTKGVIDCLRRL